MTSGQEVIPAPARVLTSPSRELSATTALIPYQSRIIEDYMAHEILVIEKSRRIGISWTLAWLAVTVAGAAATAGGMDVFYMGYEKDMTRQFIDDCGKAARILQMAASNVQEDLFKDPDNPDRDLKIFRIDLASGFEILALPSVARAFRSKQGLVILDEAAFVDDLDAMITAALALRIWGAKIIILSTHNGDTNPFNELVEGIRAKRTDYQDYHLIRITFEDAVKDGLYRAVCAKSGKEWTFEGEKQWYEKILREFGSKADQELHVIPTATKGAYIPRALISARTSNSAVVVRWGCDDKFVMEEEPVRRQEAEDFCKEELLPLLHALDPKTPHVFGQDFARSGDLSVIWIMALEQSLVRTTPFVLELRNVPYEQQRQILWFILNRLPRLRAGAIDATGNGGWLGEVTRQKFGARIQAVSFSEAWYRDNMPPFKSAFEEGSLTIPADRDVHDDIHALRLVNGVARIPVKRTEDESGQRHGDAAIAAALAYAASSADPEEYGYQAAPRTSTSTDLNPDSLRDDMPDADDMGLGMRGSVDL